MVDQTRYAEVADLTAEQIDALPYGAIRIDGEGTILGYNQYEARLSKLDASRVVGKNFFRDVAPCTAVHAFEGRMRAFVASEDATSESFDYMFPFPHGAVEVSITFIKLADPNAIVIAVERLQPED